MIDNSDPTSPVTIQALWPFELVPDGNMDTRVLVLGDTSRPTIELAL